MSSWTSTARSLACLAPIVPFRPQTDSWRRVFVRTPCSYFILYINIAHRIAVLKWRWCCTCLKLQGNKYDFLKLVNCFRISNPPPHPNPHTHTHTHMQHGGVINPPLFSFRKESRLNTGAVFRPLLQTSERLFLLFKNLILRSVSLYCFPLLTW